MFLLRLKRKSVRFMKSFVRFSVMLVRLMTSAKLGVDLLLLQRIILGFEKKIPRNF